MSTRLLMIMLVLFPFAADAVTPGLAFWKRRAASLRYTTTPQSILASNCSAIVTVRSYNSGGVPANVSSNLTVDLSGPGTTTFYSDSSCTIPITTITILSGASTASFYFIETTTSTAALTAAATGYTSATQNQTISTNPFIWTGGGANANWSTGNNWSGGAAPGISHRAVFNSTCVSNCSPQINSNISVAGIRLVAGYSGTITQTAGFTITIGTSGYVQTSGTFVGGNSNIVLSIGSKFTLTGGTFTATSAEITLNEVPITISGGTFNHNNGTVYLILAFEAVTIATGNTDFFNFKVTGYTGVLSGLLFRVTGTTKVLGTLTFGDTGPSTSNSFGSGTFAAYGNVVLLNYGVKGSGLIKVMGSTNQTIDASGATEGWIDNLEIASTGGTVSLVGNLKIESSYIVSSGTIDAGTSTLGLSPNFYPLVVTPGPETYNNVTYNGGSSRMNGHLTTISGSLKVGGTLTLAQSGTEESWTSGTIEAYGNVVIQANGSPGPGTVKIMGSTSQSIDSSGTSTGWIGSLEIDSTGGTVTFIGTIFIANSYVLTGGTIDAGTSTLTFAPSYEPLAITPGSAAYNNVKFQGSTGTSNGLHTTLTGNLIVGGLLTFAASGTSNIFGGNIEARGDVVAQNVGGPIGTATLSFNGTGPQTFTQTSGVIQKGDVTVNKASGTLTLGANASFNQTGQKMFITAGAVDMNGQNLTINSTLTISSGATLTCNGGVLTHGSLSNSGTLNCP